MNFINFKDHNNKQLTPNSTNKKHISRSLGLNSLHYAFCNATGDFSKKNL